MCYLITAYPLMETSPEITFVEEVSGVPILTCSFTALDADAIDYNITWLAGHTELTSYTAENVVPGQMVVDQFRLETMYGFGVNDAVRYMIYCNNDRKQNTCKYAYVP